jgi:transposase
MARRIVAAVQPRKPTNDAEAIVEAARRPTMRFVPVKTAEQQSRAMVFKARDLLVRQRNRIVKALRGHLMEYGVVAPAGLSFVKSLVRQIDDPDGDLPPRVVELARLPLDRFQTRGERIAVIERRLRDEARGDPEAVRLRTAPGAGPVGAMAIKAFALPMEGFRRGRDFAARPGAGAEIDRGQAAPRANVEDGPARQQAPADHRRDDPHPPGGEERRPRGLRARAIDLDPAFASPCRPAAREWPHGEA